jgi:hypothetical protein
MGNYRAVVELFVEPFVEPFVETFVETTVRLPSISVLRVSRALSSSRGRPPWTPPTHCVLYLLHGQSFCKGFGSVW